MDKEASVGMDRSPRWRAGSVSTLLLASGLAGLAALPTENAEAAFPGANGRIAFTTDRDGGDIEIYAMNADGSGQTNLTNTGGIDNDPAWSPDGTKIAFFSERVIPAEIFVMNADGSGQTNITNNSFFDGGPAWSPDGTKIAFSTFRDGDYEIYVMNADGSGQTNLTDTGSNEFVPQWSPDGTKITFQTDRDGGDYEVYIMNANGSGQTNLSNHMGDDYGTSWSPDGTKIAFGTVRGEPEIYVMNPDGSGQINLTNNNLGNDYGPSWSPDGTKIAFYSNRDGNNDIFVMNATDGSGQTNITNTTSIENNVPNWQAIKLPKTVTLKAKPKKVEEGEKTRLKATVSPCEGHEGDLVEFYRKQKLIATKASTVDCVAKKKVKVKRTTKFQAESPEQDADHLAGTSNKVKVKVLRP